ncbi:MAG TPA: histidine phosphatase family protein [Patescibacteria group bacterium]|jgi:probable phosphoglycerate mutase
MITIYLVRHGQKLPHAGDPGLTKIGLRQAKETGEYLKQFPITKIISSPHKRTVEIAQQITQVLNLKHSLHNALIERMNWEDQGITRQEFIQEWITATNDREYIPKYGDSSLATGQRIHQLVTEISKDSDHVVLVTHGGAILDYLRNIFGDEQMAVLRTQYDEGEDFRMMNCAINKVVFSDVPSLELLNFIDHLTDTSE